MIKEKLQEFGFSEKEIKVYLALLEMGSAVASVIAKKAGIKRSTAYLVLDLLIKRGLVSAVERRGIQVYEVAPPEQLVHYLKGVSAQYAGLAEAAKGMLPELQLSRTARTPTPKVRFFEGEGGVNTVYEDTLGSLEEIRVHAAFAHGESGSTGDAGAPLTGRTDIKMQLVFPEQSGKGKKAVFDRETLLASRSDIGVSSEINIYDDRVVFISAAEDFAVSIESRELADALRKTFAASEQEELDSRKAALRPAFAS